MAGGGREGGEGESWVVVVQVLILRTFGGFCSQDGVCCLSSELSRDAFLARGGQITGHNQLDQRLPAQTRAEEKSHKYMP